MDRLHGECKLDDPQQRTALLNYVREHGKVDGYAGLDANTIKDYQDRHPEFETLLTVAKTIYKNPELNSLQAYWNANAEMFEGYVMQAVMKLVLEGDVHLDEEMTYRPKMVWVDRKRSRVYDENTGEPVLELTKKVITKTNKGTPKYAIDLALELMQQTYGQSEVTRLAPSIVWMFVQFLKKRVDLPGDTYAELVGATKEFESTLKSQARLIKQKKLK